MTDNKKTQFLKSDQISEQLTFLKLFKKVTPYLKNHKPALLKLMVVIIGFTAAGRFIPFIFGYAVDHGIKAKDMDIVYICAFAYLVLEVLRSALTFYHGYFVHKLGNKVLFEIRETAVNHVQSLPMEYFNKNPIGRVVTRLTNDIVSLGQLFKEGVAAILINVIELITIFIALASISWKLALIIASVVPVLIFVASQISIKLRKFFKESKRKLAEINAFISESINGMKVLQLFNREAAQKKAFEDHSLFYKSMQLKTVSYFAQLWPVLSFFNISTVASTLLFGALFYKEWGLTVGSLSAFIILVQSFFRPLRVILERYNQFQDSLASADRVFHLLSEKPEPYKGISWNEPKGSVEVVNLNFSYSSDGPQILKSLNLKIEPGESVAIVGRTGSGKSTLISLLQRIYNAPKGSIFVDGKDICDLSLDSLRSHIGIVQQDPFIFKGSLYSNISLNNRDISKAQVEEALRLAKCVSLLKRSPLGLDMPIEERGANLSVGEKQLISFARLLAYNPSLLILDEATANIDSESEQLIQQATAEVTRGRTSIVIAHRLSTIFGCDKIIVLDNGEVIEQGNHRELLQNGGLYSQMVDAH